MDFVLNQTYLADILHTISQALLTPDIVLLLAFILYAVWCVGSILVEVFTERRNFKVSMPKFLAALDAAKGDEVVGVIEKSGLLNRQKIALLTLYDYRMLPGDSLVALTRRLIAQEDNRYAHIVGRNNTAAKVAPMLGLMGTLIPLGPGIGALASNDIASLASSIIVAFDTTVAGLAAAAVCLVIGKIRSGWYENYMGALESVMASMIEKIDKMQKAGEIKTKEPDDYAELYVKALRGAANRPTKEEKTRAKAPAADAKSKTSDAPAVADKKGTSDEGKPAAAGVKDKPADSKPSTTTAPAAE